jgi:hypothetical protein
LFQQILPFVTSICIHAAFLVVGIVFFYGAQRIARVVLRQDPYIVPSIDVTDASLPPGLDAAGRHADLLPLAQDDIKTPETNGSAWRAGELRLVGDAGGGEGDVSDTLIGPGPGGRFSRNARGPGNHNGSDSGLGDGDGGSPAPFGPRGGAGSLNGIFGPVGKTGNGNAHKIAFVCDASGSMLNKFATLRRQLANALTALRPTQSFSVIFFQGTGCLSFNHDGLVMATPENKLKAINFLEDKVIPRSETEPIAGLELAFRQKPELIYLLTDGDFPNNDLVRQRIGELNKGRAIKINTIAFVSDADTETAFKQLLQTIARENGGVYRLVKESDVE